MLNHAHYESPRQVQVRDAHHDATVAAIEAQLMAGTMPAESAVPWLRGAGCFEAEIQEILATYVNTHV